MTVKVRIAEIAPPVHPLWPEVVAVDRTEYLWTRSVMLLCGVLFTASAVIYLIWGCGSWVF